MRKNVEKVRVLLIAPVGKGVGGILSQSNELVDLLRESSSIELRVIDSAQRHRKRDGLRLASRTMRGIWQALRIIVRLIATGASFRPDVVHVRSSASLGLTRDLVLLLLARVLSARPYLQLHFGRISDLEARRNWEWRLLTATCGAADSVCVLDSRSKAVLERHLPQNKVQLIPNGVDCAWVGGIVREMSVRPNGCARPKVVFTGMVLRSKGVVELVEACSRIDSISFDLELVGPVEALRQTKLEGIAARREGGGWLRFTGAVPREEAVRRVATADVFVLPSYTEGFPLSLLEAMACGVAIVATNVGAIPEALTTEDGQTVGVLVPPRDTVALQAALECLLKDPERRRRLGTAARERCQAHFQFATVARRLEQLWIAEASTKPHHRE